MCVLCILHAGLCVAHVHACVACIVIWGGVSACSSVCMYKRICVLHVVACIAHPLLKHNCRQHDKLSSIYVTEELMLAAAMHPTLDEACLQHCWFEQFAHEAAIRVSIVAASC